MACVPGKPMIQRLDRALECTWGTVVAVKYSVLRVQYITQLHRRRNLILIHTITELNGTPWNSLKE